MPGVNPYSYSRERHLSHISTMRWAVIAVVVAAFVIRLIALLAARDAILIMDEKSYWYRANMLLDGKGFVGTYQSDHFKDYNPKDKTPEQLGAFQPPGYVAFIAGVMSVTGRNRNAVKLAQVFLSCLTVLYVYLIGRAWFDHQRGLIAAWICALYPNLIAFSHLFWSETLFIFLLVAAVYFLTRTRGLPSLISCIIAGILLGLSALTRSSIVYFLPLLVAWMVVVYRPQWRRAAVRLALVVVITMAVILPLTIRNYNVYNGFVLIDTCGPFDIWRGNVPHTFRDPNYPPMLYYEWPFHDIPVFPAFWQTQEALVELVRRDLHIANPTDLQVARYALKAAWISIIGDPADFIKRAWYKMIDMWNPTSFLVRHFHPVFNAYGPVRTIVKIFCSWAAIISYVAVMALGLAGMIMLRYDSRAWLVILLILFYNTAIIVTFGLTRFRLPLMPFIIIMAAHAIWSTARTFLRADISYD